MVEGMTVNWEVRDTERRLNQIPRCLAHLFLRAILQGLKQGKSLDINGSNEKIVGMVLVISGAVIGKLERPIFDSNELKLRYEAMI